jgi:hypothetical protein
LQDPAGISQNWPIAQLAPAMPPQVVEAPHAPS